MNATQDQVRCPKCQAIIPVEPEWRLVRCPHCGDVVTRMGGDAAYD